MKKIYRIFDANINRALEGLRVVEEITRFLLEDKKLSSKVKSFRAKVKAACQKIPYQDLLIKIRDSKKDVGWKVYPKSEARRADIMSIYKSNIKRATEALRVLEEFSKLVSSRVGQAFKDLRFMVYDLEKEIYEKTAQHLKVQKLNFDLYAIVDSKKVARRVLKSGVKIIQYRDKKISKNKYLNNARVLQKLVQKHKAVFIVNDYVDIAKQIDADGVHLGQADLSPRRAREILGDDKIIGVSTHSYKQALRAAKSATDYLACGPIYKTKTKPWRRAVGIDLLKRVVKVVKKPVVAIGGINKSNLREIKRTGCKRVAVVNGIFDFV